MYTPRGHLSTANTITAASSRLDLSETRDFVLDRAAVFSQLDLTKSGTNPPSYSITFAPTLSLTKPSWINAPLNLRHIDVVVLVTCFVTGLTDTAMFASKHQCSILCHNQYI